MELKPGSHIHLMGICGTAMGSLAGILHDQGFRVTGSDQNVYPPMSTQLEKLGIPIMVGYKKENLKEKPDLVIVGNVISSHFEEAQEMMAQKLQYTSLPKAMGDYVIDGRNSIVVAGTHGKTTTTSIMAWLAQCCGIKAGFLIGGIPINFGQSFRAPTDDWFVIEGDEYDTAFFDKVPKFIHYKPKFVILTSIEFDHADIYESLDQIKDSFRKLIELIPEDGILVANGEDENVLSLLKNAKCKVFTYGHSQGDYSVADRESLMGRNQFTVVHNNERVADLAVKTFGPHNTLNVLASFALSVEMGWSRSQVLQGLANFKGVKRRQEVIYEKNNITVVEDFAHHPTAVKLTIDCMREAYGDRRLICIFEPRSATARRNIFFEDYLMAYEKSDVVIYPAAFDQSKIPETDRFSSEEFVKQLNARGVQAHFLKDTDHILSYLKSEIKSGDVVLIMSNGGFDNIYGRICDLLG